MENIGCVNIREFNLPACPESIKIDLGLEPNTDYVIVIKDKFDSNIRFTDQSDDEGVITMTINNREIFNPFAGIFELQIFKDGCLVMLDVCGIEANQINLTFSEFTGEVPDAMIKCECDEN